MVNIRAAGFRLKIKQMAAWGLIILAVALAAGQIALAKGIFLGGTVAIFNFYLVAGTVTASGGMTPRKAQNLFMRRALARMFISFMTLFAAIYFGVDFFLGTALGLVLQMLTYTIDAFKLIMKGVNS